MKFNSLALGLLGFVAATYAEVYLSEKFEDGDAWTERWTTSSYRGDLGKFTLTSSKWLADSQDASRGIQTSEDYRFYGISTPFKSTFNNKGKDMVVQFSVKHDQKIDCGGGYIKLLKPDYNPPTFSGDSEYNIMFGPDICGTKSIVHVILNYKGKNHDMKKTIAAPTDSFTHFYTLILKPDQTYKVLLDGEEKESGSILEDWDLLPPKTIPDPNAKKPEDWVDEAKIPDPEDKKPDNWDDIPEFIPDPDAKKPDDWDDEMDGDWEAPSISNPEYQGEWTPKMIDNPAYKGLWEHPIIDNPDYKLDEEIYVYNTGALGIDVWQVKSGSIFDNFLITDEIELAEKERSGYEELKKVETEAKEAFEKAEEEAKKKLEGHDHDHDHSPKSEEDEIDAEFGTELDIDDEDEPKEEKPKEKVESKEDEHKKDEL